MDKESKPSGAHYNFRYKGVLIDPYRIFKVYSITDPAQQHAIKKLLRAGRSIKDLRKDISEVKAALDRWLEMLDEDEGPALPAPEDAKWIEFISDGTQPLEMGMQYFYGYTVKGEEFRDVVREGTTLAGIRYRKPA